MTALSSLTDRVALYRARRRAARGIETALTEAQPARPFMRHIVVALHSDGLNGPGKMRAPDYLPGFLDRLRANGVETRIACAHHDLALARLTRRPTAITVLYNEDLIDLSGDAALAALCRDALVFNAPRTGAIVARKDRANAFLGGLGIPMPSTDPGPDVPVLSLSPTGSDQGVTVAMSIEEADPARYNVELIDTVVEIDGRRYVTVVRLMCVGRTLLGAFPRGRPVDEGMDARGKTTPLDAPMLTALHARIVEPNLGGFRELADQLGGVLGPGFFAHDVLVEAGTERILLAETNFKFMNKSTLDHLASIGADLPFYAAMADTRHFASQAADAFLATCAAHGLSP